MAVSPAVNATGSPPVVMTACSIAYNEAAKLWACGTFFCIQLPFRTLQLCWRTQLFLISFPFHCTYRVLTFVKHSIVNLLSRTKQDSPVQILQNFLECDLVEKRKVLRSVQELRAGSMLAIAKMSSLNRRVERYQKQVGNWRKETDQHSRALSTIAAEERKLIRVIASALKSLRRLKDSKDVIDDKFTNTMQEMCNFCQSVSINGYDEYSSEDSVNEINAFLRAGYERLSKQMEMMRQLIDGKDLGRNYTENELPHTSSPPSTYENSIASIDEHDCNNRMNLLSLSMGTLDTVMALLNAENAELKKRLKATNDQLKDMKNTSFNLNEKIIALETQLQRASELLRTVEADRNDMRERLLTLQGMIEEEEVYLSFDAPCDESFNELYVTTKEFKFSDLETRSTTDNYGKIEHLELEWTSVESDEDSKGPKSLELSLSR